MPGYDPVKPSLEQQDREERLMVLEQLVRLLPYYEGFTPCPKCEFGNMTTDLVKAKNFHGRLVQRHPDEYGFTIEVMLRKCPNCGGHVLQKPLDYPGVTL